MRSCSLVSGITSLLPASAAALCRRIVDDRVFRGATVTFDVNLRPALAGTGAADDLLALARCSDVVFVGRDEAETLWGTPTADAVRALLPEPPVLVVKDAAAEAGEFSRDGRVAVPATTAETAEPTWGSRRAAASARRSAPSGRPLCRADAGSLPGIRFPPRCFCRYAVGTNS